MKLTEFAATKSYLTPQLIRRDDGHVLMQIAHVTLIVLGYIAGSVDTAQQFLGLT
jgi:hypothetical protein